MFAVRRRCRADRPWLAAVALAILHARAPLAAIPATFAPFTALGPVAPFAALGPLTALAARLLMAFAADFAPITPLTALASVATAARFLRGTRIAAVPRLFATRFVTPATFALTVTGATATAAAIATTAGVLAA